MNFPSEGAGRFVDTVNDVSKKAEEQVNAVAFGVQSEANSPVTGIAVGCTRSQTFADAYTSAYMALALSMRESTVSPANRLSRFHSV